MTTRTITPDSELAAAFRAARRYHREGYGVPVAFRPAGLALKRAREALARVREAEAAYLAANPLSGDTAAPGAYPFDTADGHKAVRELTAAKSRAGLFHTAASWAAVRGSWAEDRTAYWPGAEPGPFRDIRKADECEGGPAHGGWYDNGHGELCRDGSGLVWGVVARLPGRDGRPRFLAGWQHGGCDGGPTIATGRGFFDNESDAARYADGLAERAAEAEREYREAWEAGQSWAELGERIAAERAEALELARERRAAMRDGLTARAACRTIRHHIATLWDSICEARAERRELAEGVSRANADAWAEGAGLTAAEALALA